MRAVDRVDDPLARAGPGGGELLADDGVARPGALELGADQLLGVAVGVADQGQVGLGVDPQVLGAKPRDGDALDGIREHVGEAQVVVVAGHDAQPSGRAPKILRPGDDPVALRSQSSLGRI